MSQVDVAKRMGRPVQAINEIIKGHKAITPDTALQLEQVTGVPAALWTGLEEEYRLVLARQQEQAQLAEEAELVDPALYRAMAKLGWVKHVRDKLERYVSCGSSSELHRCITCPKSRPTAPPFASPPLQSRLPTLWQLGCVKGNWKPARLRSILMRRNG